MQALHVTLAAAVLYVSSVHSICQKCLLVRAKAMTYYCTNSSHRIVALSPQYHDIINTESPCCHQGIAMQSPKQAGAELGQAQLKLGLDLNSINLN